MRGFLQYEELINQFNGMSVDETAEEVAIIPLRFSCFKRLPLLEQQIILGCDLRRHDEDAGRTPSYNGRLMPYKY